VKKDIFWKDLCNQPLFSQFLQGLKKELKNLKEEKDEISLKEAYMKFEQRYGVARAKSSEDSDWYFKLGIMGGRGVGKTSFLKRIAVGIQTHNQTNIFLNENLQQPGIAKEEVTCKRIEFLFPSLTRNSC
jgi:hypothetical protein